MACGHLVAAGVEHQGVAVEALAVFDLADEDQMVAAIVLLPVAAHEVGQRASLPGRWWPVSRCRSKVYAVGQEICFQ